LKAPADFAAIASIQIARMQVDPGRPITAVRLLIDRNRR
jgi:hypothetical protein